MSNPSVQLPHKQVDFSLKDLLDMLKKDIMLTLNCHAIATVQGFDSETQTVKATVNYKKTYLTRNADGTYTQELKDYALLLDVPTIFLGGGNFCLTFPVAVGDECLILFNDRDLDNWFQSGQVGPVASNRLHSFSDGVALVGLRSLANSITDFDTTRAVLRTKDGTAMVGVGATLIKLANGTTTLNTQLQNLCTELENLCTALGLLTVVCAAPGNPSSVPVNAATFATLKTQITATASAIGGLLE